MGVSRISSVYMVDQGIHNLQNNLFAMNNLQNKIASGKNISNPSDDPVGLTQLLRLNLALNQDDRYGRNIDDALGEMSASEVAIKGIVDVTHRVKELAVQAANGVNSQNQLDAIGQEIDGLIEHLVQLGNTKFAGRYLFSGFLTDTAPFDAGGANYNGSPNAAPTDYQRQVEIAEGTYVPVNINGDDLLGSVATGSGLLFTINQLRNDITAGDFDAIRADIDLIAADQTTILQLQTSLGGRINQLELTKNRIEDRKTVQTAQIAKIQEVNMPEAISNLNFQQTIYQASLGIMSRIMQTSLVNFLR